MGLADITQQFDLGGRVAIVTGGSRGIGKAIAQGYAAAGAHVVVTSRKIEACDALVAEIGEAGGSALAVAAHMGKLDDIASLVSTTVDHFGGVDIVVNNAANALALPLEHITEEAWHKAVDTNLRGPVFLVKEALPHLLASDNASVINVMSNAAYMYPGAHLLYASAKSGIGGATRAMAAEFADRGIRVNGLVPGTFDTDMVRQNSPEAQASMAKASLLGRAAHPDEIVPLALLLASDAGGFMTGQIYSCDAGQFPR